METLLYMTDHPLTTKEILEVLETKSFQPAEIESIIQEIKTDYETSGSGLCVMEVAGGVQVATNPEMAPFVRRLYKERLTTRLSPSALETLSIVAYKQPIARSEVEQIRGVEATGVMDTLLERRMIKVVGRKETIGRPLLYGTTPEFLRRFGLKHLSDLPDLDTIPVNEPAPLTDTLASPESPTPEESDKESVTSEVAEEELIPDPVH